MKYLVRLLGCAASLHTAVSFGAEVGKISYLTYFDAVSAMASDAQGNVYLAGEGISTGLPVTSGTYHPLPYPACSSGPCTHALVAKVSAGGSLMWATWLGGNGSDAATGIAVDTASNVYVAGTTASSNFPVTPDALQASLPAGASPQGFLVKLDPAGAKLLYGTYLGNGNALAVSAVAWGASGTLAVTGTLTTPTGSNGLVSAWRSAGMNRVFSQVLGGLGGRTAAHAAAIGGDGGIYVTGMTNSIVFPLKNAIAGLVGTGDCPVQLVLSATPCAGAFVTKFGADGGIVYSTLLGGSQENSGTAIVVDAPGSAIVVGNTASSDFPLVHAAMRYPGNDGCMTETTPFSRPPCPHGFVAKLTPEGSGLVFSTYLGGRDAVVLAGAALDSSGGLWVVGTTMNNSFPATVGADEHASMAPNQSGAWVVGNQGVDGIEWRDTAGIVAEFKSDGTLEYASYFGGAGGGDQALMTAADRNGGVWFAGLTRTMEVPLTPGAISRVNDSYHFLARTDLTTAGAAPQIDRVGVLNSANLYRRPVAPGEIVTIFGSGLGPSPGVGAQLDARGFVAKQLAGTSVTFDGMAAPLLYVSEGQINAVAPFGISGQTSTQIAVTVNGVTTPPDTEAVAMASPAFYTTDMSGTGHAVALNQDGTVNSAANPAPRGSVMSFWITGAGLLNQTYEDGEIVTANPAGLALPLVVHTGGIQYAGQAPGMVAGVVQLNLVVGADLPPWISAAYLYFTIGGVFSQLVLVELR